MRLRTNEQTPYNVEVEGSSLNLVPLSFAGSYLSAEPAEPAEPNSKGRNSWRSTINSYGSSPSDSRTGLTDLDRYYSSLSFFDADGMRFHLPAYLVADLECRLQTADVLFHLVYMAHGAASRFDTLSPAQREAVRDFLLLRLSDPHRGFERPMIEAALRDYWTAHTES